METFIRRSEITWQTRVISAAVVNTIPDKKAQEQLLKQINAYDLNGGEEEIEAPADTSGNGALDQDAVVRQALERNAKRRGPGLPFR